MRQTRHLIPYVLAAVLVSGCGDGADTQAADPVALTTLPIIEAATTTTSPAIETADRSGTTNVPVPPPTTTPPLPTTTTAAPPPTFSYTVEPVTRETVWASWNEDCPLHFEDLSLLKMRYWNFNGRAVTGQMVINSKVVDDVVAAFEGLFNIRFPIERMALVDEYEGDDKAAMRANVTSGFNCRFVDGTDNWSNHAFGLAIDINPLINPWAREGNVLPLEGTKYANREHPIPGMINLGDRPIAIFGDLGWTWGGVWTSADYMHFSQPGN